MRESRNSKRNHSMTAHEATDFINIYQFLRQAYRKRNLSISEALELE